MMSLCYCNPSPCQSIFNQTFIQRNKPL